MASLSSIFSLSPSFGYFFVSRVQHADVKIAQKKQKEKKNLMRIYCPDFLFYSSADMCDVLRLETSPKYYFPPPCAIHNLKEKNKTAREDSIDEK